MGVLAFLDPGTAGAAFKVRELPEADRKALEQNFDRSLRERKGPYAKNTCMCKDGRSAPVLGKDGVIRNICETEANTVYCAAHKAPWGLALEERGVYIGNIFARDLHDWDRFPDQDNLVRGYILESFVITNEPEHKLAKLRQLKGLAGSEYEAPASRAMFERYVADERYQDFRHFLLAYELQKRYFTRGGAAKMQEVRDMASRIQGQDPEFKPLRDAVHNQVSAALLPLLTAYHDAAPPGQTRDMIGELIAEIRTLTDMSAEDLQPLVGEVEDPAARAELQTILEREGQGIDELSALAELMVASRQAVAERRVSPADARRVIDLNVMAMSVLQARGTALMQSGDVRTVGDHLSLMRVLANATYGTGLLAARERAAAVANLDAMLASPTMDRAEFERRLGQAARIVEWAHNGALLAFSEVWAEWLLVMPSVARLPDDILRGSPLLLFGEVEQQLDDFVTGQAEMRHDLSEQSVKSGVRALNPGLAVAPLRLNPPSGTYSRDEVVALELTPEDLQPTSGIVTQGEGNVVSHVQLLARALGIPNAVMSPASFDLVESMADQEVFYAVTPAGRVILKREDAMTATEQAVLAEFTGNLQRTGDGRMADASGGKLDLEVEKLDLSANTPLDLATVRRKDSGIRCGPKAAFLGELAHLFPDKVSRGVVLPFGVYYDHYQQAAVVVPKAFEGKGIAQAGEPLPAFVEKTYQEFFGEMVASGMDEAALSEWVQPRLEVIQASIVGAPLNPKIRKLVREELDRLGLLSPGDKEQTLGVFARSDTNVEDLENFNGAGLNLTIFNLKSLDDVYEGIKEVWASPFTYRSFSWRQTLIDEPEWVLPSVVILESVASEKSGVAITADINTNDPGMILIATSEGVGGAVDGTPAETLLWSKDGVELITMFKSPVRQLLKSEGGVEVVPATGEEYVLSDEEVAELVQVAQAIESKLEPTLNAQGAPRPWDIEFGFANDKLWLFQSRPFIGSDEVANLPALAALDESTGELTQTIALEDVVE